MKMDFNKTLEVLQMENEDNEVTGCSGECDYCEAADTCEQSEYYSN